MLVNEPIKYTEKMSVDHRRTNSSSSSTNIPNVDDDNNNHNNDNNNDDCNNDEQIPTTMKQIFGIDGPQTISTDSADLRRSASEDTFTARANLLDHKLEHRPDKARLIETNIMKGKFSLCFRFVVMCVIVIFCFFGFFCF